MSTKFRFAITGIVMSLMLVLLLSGCNSSAPGTKVQLYDGYTYGSATISVVKISFEKTVGKSGALWRCYNGLSNPIIELIVECSQEAIADCSLHIWAEVTHVNGNKWGFYVDRDRESTDYKWNPIAVELNPGAQQSFLISAEGCYSEDNPPERLVLGIEDKSGNEPNAFANFDLVYKESDSVPITLSEAWDLATDYAKNWSKDARMSTLISISDDDPDIEELNKSDSDGGQTIEEVNEKFSELSLGQDGKRRAWLAFFSSESQDSYLRVKILDGVVVYTSTEPFFTGQGFLDEKPPIDSPEIIEIVLTEKPDFLMGPVEDAGFNFVYFINDDGQPELTVLGAISDHGTLEFTAIYLNLEGEIIYQR
jgi:hypothetical protein